MEKGCGIDRHSSQPFLTITDLRAEGSAGLARCTQFEIHTSLGVPIDNEQAVSPKICSSLQR